MVDITTMTNEELEAENARLMAARAEAEATFKDAQKAIQVELDRRTSAARLASVLDTMTDADKEALKMHLASIGPGSEG